MDTLIFTCKTVTPLAMSGADGKTPELRPPGIKAALRFWWRALHGHLQIDKLREKEGEIFGDTKQRSKVLIKVIEDIDPHVISTPLLPHRTEVNRNATTTAFSQGSQFKIKLTTTSSSAISAEQLKSLFVLTCTLGGLGKRSRRGFGSITVTEINSKAYKSPTTVQALFGCIEEVVPKRFQIVNNHIESKTVNKETRDEYPKLWKIEIGVSSKTTREIGDATHRTKRDLENEKDYGKSLGSGSPRFASPVYISVMQNENPVISTLKKESRVDFELQETLKHKILNS
jgi:CRISPR-associated protein Cmr1